MFANKLEVITRGFIYVKDSKDLMNKSKKFVIKKLSGVQKSKKDITEIKRKLEREVSNFLRKETGMTPMIIVHFITI